MARFVYFTVLLVLCGAGDSLETTTSPQQENTGDTKELCEVQSEISIAFLRTINLLNMGCKKFCMIFSISHFWQFNI